MTSREKVEAWYLENWGHTEDDHETLFERDPDSTEEYYRLGVRLAWESWQAASEASEQKLEESRREFRAADTTIHNLELKITDMAVQLANAESKCRELAAENVALNDKMNKLATWPGIEFYSSAWEFCNLDGNDALEFMCDVKTPATDAFLAEVRAHGVEMYADTLDRGADDAERDGFEDGMKFLRAEAEGVRKFAAKLRKGVQS
ncbi:hypothetical protein HT424_003250 [Escherichia coli]|nr:hypothetical protein [Escherichia coli]